MAKVKSGSKLLKAIGKNKKEQMAALYPGMSTASKSKNIGKKISKSKNVSSSAKMLDSRRNLAGVKDKSKGSKIGGKLKTAAALAAGYAAGKGLNPTKAKTNKAKAKESAKELLKKQKDKKKHHSK